MTSIAELLGIDFPEWQRDAACQYLDPQLFFKQSNQKNKAFEICNSCPVKAECLDWILNIESRQGIQAGIYGGMSANARKKLHRCYYKGCNNLRGEGAMDMFCSELCQTKHRKDYQRKYGQEHGSSLKAIDFNNYDYPYKGRIHS